MLRIFLQLYAKFAYRTAFAIFFCIFFDFAPRYGQIAYLYAGYTYIMIRERIEELRRQLDYHNHRYYVENAPEISDFEFDTMMHELQRLEAEHPEYADPTSPTMRVGSDLCAEFRTVRHRYPMLSLGNT